MEDMELNNQNEDETEEWNIECDVEEDESLEDTLQTRTDQENNAEKYKDLALLYQNIFYNPYSANSMILDSLIEECPFDKVAEYDSKDFLVYELNDELHMIAKDLKIVDATSCSIVIMSYMGHVQKHVEFNGIVGTVITDFNVVLRPNQFNTLTDAFLVLIFAIDRLIILTNGKPILEKNNESKRKIEKKYTTQKESEFKAMNRSLRLEPGCYIVDTEICIKDIEARHQVLSYLISTKKEQKSSFEIKDRFTRQGNKLQYMIFMPPFSGKTYITNAMKQKQIISDKITDNPSILLDNNYSTNGRIFMLGIVPSIDLISKRLTAENNIYLKNIIMRLQLFNLAYHAQPFLQSIDQEISLFTVINDNSDIRIGVIDQNVENIKNYLIINGINMICFREDQSFYIVMDNELISYLYNNELPMEYTFDEKAKFIIELKKKIRRSMLKNNQELLNKVYAKYPNSVN